MLVGCFSTRAASSSQCDTIKHAVAHDGGGSAVGSAHRLGGAYGADGPGLIDECPKVYSTPTQLTLAAPSHALPRAPQRRRGTSRSCGNGQVGRAGGGQWLAARQPRAATLSQVQRAQRQIWQGGRRARERPHRSAAGSIVTRRVRRSMAHAQVRTDIVMAPLTQSRSPAHRR